MRPTTYVLNFRHKPPLLIPLLIKDLFSIRSQHRIATLTPSKPLDVRYLYCVWLRVSSIPQAYSSGIVTLLLSLINNLQILSAIQTALKNAGQCFKNTSCYSDLRNLGTGTSRWKIYIKFPRMLGQTVVIFLWHVYMNDREGL